MQKSMMTYEEAKAYLKDKGLRTKEEYKIWWIANKKENLWIGLPQNPEIYYEKCKLD